MIRATILLSCLLTLAMPAAGQFMPPEHPRAAGMRDIMLAYMRPDRWSAQDFLPYVAWLDHEDVPRDWFFDSFLFLMYGGAPSGGSYMDGTANLDDWRFYLDLLFAEDRCLAGLERCTADVGARLGQPERILPVIIMIPYLKRDMEQFGAPGGAPLDPTQDADRAAACTWLVDEVLRRWAQRDFPHLRLWGFYWMYEGIGAWDEALVRTVAGAVHERGMGLHWIPWFRAAGHDRWRALGFDFAIMQPNYAFRPLPRGLLVTDEDRLSHNANLSREAGLGVEMEMGSRVLDDLGHRLNLQLYLNHGVDELDGYMNESVRAWYHPSDIIAVLQRSERPDLNRLYDDLYRFHIGAYTRRRVSLSEGAACTVNGRAEPRLTDGLWMTRGERTDRVMVADAPATIELDLGQAQMVGDVRVHVLERVDADPSAPSLIRVLAGAEAGDLGLAAESPCPALHAWGDWRGGFALLSFERRMARHLRLEVVAGPGSQVGLDEVTVLPTPHLALGRECEVTGDLLTDPAEARVALTDGYLGGEGLAFAGAGSASLDLGDSWYLRSALVHATWPEGSAPPSCRVAVTDGATEQLSEQVTAAGDGWVRVPLPRMPARSLRFELTGAPQVRWDEIELAPLRNLASDKPYTLDPAFEAKYPDSGGIELTDGVLSERGFGDGRTVGWYGVPVSVVIDVGTETSVNAFRAHVQGGGHAAVRYPAVMQVWAWDEAGVWRALAGGEPQAQVLSSQPVGDQLSELAWLRLDFAPTRTRRVKVVFGSNAWLMLSELQVLSGEENIATGRPYHLFPAPTSEEKYADDAVRLTDGEYARPGEWRKAVGWNTGGPEVVVDLLDPAEVSLVRVHCLGGGHGGVYFPTAEVATSLDGHEWSPEVALSIAPPEPGGSDMSTFLSGELPPRLARYVRVIVQRRGWAMLDEIEVY